MDLEQAFEHSYDRLVGHGLHITPHGQAFFQCFCENFIRTSPEVAVKFVGTDMARQVGILQKGMFHLISFYLLKKDSDFLRETARSHDSAHRDIPPKLYDLWLQALLQTVEEMDAEYTDEVGLAWQVVMTPGILYFKHYYQGPYENEGSS